MKKTVTLSIIHKDDQILLGMKKRGFGAGKWNGFGGKVEGEESVKKAAIREITEESGLNPDIIDAAGVITFTFENDPTIMEVHIFSVSGFSGNIKPSEEMDPKWFRIDLIPYDHMWPADKYWIPLLVAGKKFVGRVHFDRPSSPEHTSIIIKHDIKEVEPMRLEKPNTD